ncbi:MAG: hypothetical protein V4655_00090 [Bdellovibrionota bacterium]
MSFSLRFTFIFASLWIARGAQAQENEVKKADNHSPDIATSPTTTPLSVDPDEEILDEAHANLDPLEFTQKELQGKFPGGIALNVGPVMPWSDYGASFFWSRYDIVQSLSLGAGNFDFSDNYKERNYLVDTDSQSVYYAARWFFLGFGPLYIEPFAGLARWSGSIKPSGYDDVNDSLSASLNSRFDITGVSVGGNLGIMWLFTNGLFLDYNLFNLSSAAFISKRFTTNTEEAKKNVRKELAGPLTMSNLHLRIGYSIAL